jgi:hypothetical protein
MQLFSFDPKQRPACACPHCGWQAFWQQDLHRKGQHIQCEWCKRWITESELVEPTPSFLSKVATRRASNLRPRENSEEAR